MLSGDLKMASFCSDMEEIHRIVMERPDISDVSYQYSSEYETTDYSSPEGTENVNTVEASREQHLTHVQIIVMDKHRDENQFGNNAWNAVEMKRRL